MKDQVSVINQHDGLLENYSQLLEKLYASLWHGDGMEPALEAFKDHFKGLSATLMAVTSNPRHMRYGWNVGIPEKYRQWYIENDMVSQDPSIDVFEQESEKTNGFVAVSHLLGDIPLIDTVSDDFKPWLKAENIVDTAGLVIPTNENDEHLILALQRDEAAGPFTEQEIMQLNLLAPHVKQTVQLFIKFYRQQNDNSSLQAAINSLSQPTIVINELMQVRHSNPAADDIINNGNSFRIEDDKFFIENEELHHQFMYRAWEIASASEGIDKEMTSTILIPQDSGPITITLSPMFAADNEHSKGSKGVLLQIFDPQSQTLPKAEKIKDIFRLSQTEALLCEYLVEGLTLKEIARERDVSINTVREQMRNVFNKTGYNRQSELIVAILRAIP